MSLLIPPCPSSPHVYVAIASFSTGGRLSSLFCAKTFSNHIVSSSLLVSPQRGVSPCFSRSMPSKGKLAELFCGTSGHEGKAHESELSLHLVQYTCRAPSYNTVLCLVGMPKLWTSTERRVRGSYHAKPSIFLQLCKQVLPVSWLHLLYLSGASQRAPLLPKALSSYLRALHRRAGSIPARCARLGLQLHARTVRQVERGFWYWNKPQTETAHCLNSRSSTQLFISDRCARGRWEWAANRFPGCPITTTCSRLGNNNFSLKILSPVPILGLELVARASQHVTLQSNLQNKDAAGSSWGGFVCYFLSHSSADETLPCVRGE